MHFSLKTALYASFIIVALYCGYALSNTAAAVDHGPMSLSDQVSCAGGDDPLVIWANNKLCVTPTTTDEKNASACNKPNTACTAGNQLCAQQMAVVNCADSKEYQNPLECVAKDTTYQCADNQSQDKVNCYKLTSCACKFDQQNDLFNPNGTNTWICAPVFGIVPAQVQIYPCQVRPPQ